MRISDWSSDVCSSDLGSCATTLPRSTSGSAATPRSFWGANTMFNVRYDTPSGSRLYLNEPTDIITAWSQCHKFHEKYVGKPYPNGKGYYPFTNPRVVAV